MMRICFDIPVKDGEKAKRRIRRKMGMGCSGETAMETTSKKKKEEKGKFATLQVLKTQ